MNKIDAAGDTEVADDAKVSDASLRQVAREVVKAAAELKKKQWDDMVESNTDAGPRGPVAKGPTPAAETYEPDFASIQQRILTALTPTSNDAASMDKCLIDAGNKLRDGAIDDMATKGTNLISKDGDNDWHGSAALSFQTQVISPIVTCREAQLEIVRELSMAIVGYQRLIDRRRRDYLVACQTTVVALESAKHASGQAMAKLVLIGAFAGLAASIGSLGGGPVGLFIGALGVLSSAITVGDTVGKSTETSEIADINGNDPESILKSLTTVLDNTDKKADTGCSSLGRGLATSISTVRATLKHDSGKGHTKLVPSDVGTSGPTNGDASGFERPTGADS